MPGLCLHICPCLCGFFKHTHGQLTSVPRPWQRGPVSNPSLPRPTLSAFLLRAICLDYGHSHPAGKSGRNARILSQGQCASPKEATVCLRPSHLSCCLCLGLQSHHFSGTLLGASRAAVSPISGRADFLKRLWTASFPTQEFSQTLTAKNKGLSSFSPHPR